MITLKVRGPDQADDDSDYVLVDSIEVIDVEDGEFDLVCIQNTPDENRATVRLDVEGLAELQRVIEAVLKGWELK